MEAEMMAKFKTHFKSLRLISEEPTQPIQLWALGGMRISSELYNLKWENEKWQIGESQKRMSSYYSAKVFLGSSNKGFMYYTLFSTIGFTGL